mgnify:CR=1 FL=1
MVQKLKNKIMLITYSDCMGNNLKDLSYVLDHYLKDAVEGLHILPFFPSSADRGFSPTTYKIVDPAFGTWDDIMSLSEKYYLMYDYMINHLSDQSAIYKDFLEKKDDSEYKDFFIRFKDFWSNGEPTQADLDKIYVRKEKPYVEVQFADGSKEKLWSTFSDQQIDINCQRSETAKKFMRDNLEFLAEHGAALIRLDAFAYATKKEGTNCFFVEPDVWNLLEECREVLEGHQAEILPEIHEHYFIEKKLEQRGYYTYDFQLPMLLLNAFFYGKTLYLKNWLNICPRRQFTTLDTHDGIGVVDVRYLMPDDEILKTKQKVFEINPDITEVYVKSNFQINFKQFDTYQINCTYYCALGSDDQKYLMSRAVQFFAPGIPQVYYVGLFAGENDFDLFHKTGAHRDVNRHYYSIEEIDNEFRRPVVQKLNRMMKFRNEHPSFQGTFHLLDSDEHSLRIRWEYGTEYSELYADFINFNFEIKYSQNGQEKNFE